MVSGASDKIVCGDSAGPGGARELSNLDMAHRTLIHDSVRVRVRADDKFSFPEPVWEFKHAQKSD